MHEFLHLTSVNPYISSTLATCMGGNKPSGKGVWAHLPRQPSGAAMSAQQQSVGISGFAFQGTNAHVVLR